MEQGVRCSRGGIRRLRRILDGKHSEAIRADLLDRLGLHIEDIGEWISWVEFRIWLENLPATGESAYFRARHPDNWWYDLPTRMASWQLFALQGANWQRSGGQGSRPVMFEPPTTKPVRPQPNNVVPIDQIKDRLEAARQAARAAKPG